MSVDNFPPAFQPHAKLIEDAVNEIAHWFELELNSAVIMSRLPGGRKMDLSDEVPRCKQIIDQLGKDLEEAERVRRERQRS